MKTQQRNDPILSGVIDTFLGVELLAASSIPHRNRLAVILIDSAFETACRAFLQHKLKIKLTDAHKHRETLMKVMKSKLGDIDQEVWNQIDYYYEEVRCDFYHQSAGKTITDPTLLDYKETVEFVINQAFGVRIDDLVQAQIESIKPSYSASEAGDGNDMVLIPLPPERTDKILSAVHHLKPKNVGEVNEFFRQQGDPLRLDPGEFLNVVARNTGSKKLFYFDKALKAWDLSGLGKFRLNQLLKERKDAK